ncbi:MAG: pseudouridine synthase [Panacagrimonas sp.]
MTDRIQKVLATAGVASRRAIEEWIAEGRITVNGRPAEVGQKVDHHDHVRVDGRLVALQRKPEPTRVILFRKKTGELVTRDDPDGRRTVFRKLPELETGRWIAVGRLDINTSGLLLMTTDGELARRLTHPSFEVTRTYAVRVLGEITSDIRRQLLTGVTLDDGPAKCESLVSADPPEAEDAEGAANRWYEIVMREGRNRVVRRLFEGVGLQVSRLIRIAYGPVQLGRGIKAGSYREATPEELAALLAAAKMDVPVAEKARRAPRSALARKYRPDAGPRKPRKTPGR